MTPAVAVADDATGTPTGSGRHVPTDNTRSRLVTPPTESAQVIERGREDDVVGLLADVGFEKPLAGNVVFSGISIDRGTIVMRLTRVGADTQLATLRLFHRDKARDGHPRSRSFGIATELHVDEPAVRSAVSAAIESIRAHDDGGFYVVRRAAGDGQQRHSLPPWGRIGALLALLATLALLTWLSLRHLPWTDLASVYVKPTHLLPTAIQVLIFAYWALYWRELPAYVPEIGLQIAYAYALDIVLALAGRRHWRATAGPLPIVGSINLFVQFHAGEWPMQYGIITVAMLSKVLLTRGGRHIFNPSAFGIAIIGLVNLAFPRMGLGDIAHQFDLPPNMTEVILLLALVVQARVPVVLVSFACALGLLLHGTWQPEINFSPYWSPVALVIVLLATDPATSPRTGLGRVLYGVVLGVLIGWAGEILVSLGHSDFYGKVLPLPLCNLLVPAFDRWSQAIVTRLRWLGTALAPRFNAVHMALFFAMMASGLIHGGKSGRFVTDSHALNATQFLHWADDGTLRCEENKLFCGGFTLADEATCWWNESTQQNCGNDRPKATGNRPDSPDPRAR